jgi:hypothetical protein
MSSPRHPGGRARCLDRLRAVLATMRRQRRDAAAVNLQRRAMVRHPSLFR